MATLPKMRGKYSPTEVLGTWRELMEALPTMNETELKAALDKELSKPNEEQRADIILRLHRRYSKLRQDRELHEMLPDTKERNSEHV